MIDWLAVKEAAGPAGWTPAEGVAPRPVLTPEQQRRKDAFWKGFAGHFKDPQSYKDALSAGIAAPARVLAKIPGAAYGALSYPVSMFGQGVNWANGRLGLVTPAQEKANREAYSLLNKPVEWWNGMVDRALPYRKALQESPEFKGVMEPVENVGAMAALPSVKDVATSIRRLPVRARALSRKTRNLIDPSDVYDRAHGVAGNAWTSQQKTLNHVNNRRFLRDMGVPDKAKVRFKWRDTDTIPSNASFVYNADNKLNDITNQYIRNYTGPKPATMRHVALTRKIKPTDFARHEAGHAAVYNTGANRHLIDKTDPGPFSFWRNIRMFRDPKLESPQVMNEWLADLHAFGRNGELSRYRLLRHHPNYLSYEIPARQEALKNLGWGALWTGLGAGDTAIIVDDIRRKLKENKEQGK